MKKRLISLLLAMVMLISALPVSAFATEAEIPAVIETEQAASPAEESTEESEPTDETIEESTEPTDEPVHTHDYAAVVTDPTCTAGGFTTYTCACGDTYTGDETASTGHTEETVPAVDPTCTETGLTEGKICSVCGETLVAQESVGVITHTQKTVKAVKATCTKTGLTAGTVCAECGETLTAQKKTQALDHDYVNDVCSRCGKIKVYTPEITVSNIEKSGKIRITWDATKNAVKYKVYRANEQGEAIKCILTTTKLSCTHTGAVAGETYYYYVVAVGEDGTLSEASKTVSGTGKLARPQIDLTNVDKSGKIRLTWEPVEGAVKYQIFRSATDESFTRIWTQTGTTYINTKAEPGETWFYYVVAVGANGEVSVPSVTVGGICKLARPVITVSNVEKSGKNQITWEPVAGAVKYEVYCAAEQEGQYKKILTTKNQKCIHTGAVAGEKYEYYVVAIAENKEANSADSAVKARTADLPRPVVTASNVAKNGKVQLTWNEIEGAVKYQIFRSTTKDGEFKRVYTTTGTKYTHTSGEVGVTYFYKVKAIAENTNANSAFSVTKQRTRDLDQPVVTYAAPNAEGLPRLTWEPVEGAVAYKIYRSKTGAPGSFYLKHTVTGTAYNNTDAKIDVQYFYKVKAVAENTNANSAFSEVQSVTAVENVYDYVYSSYTTYKYSSWARLTNLRLCCNAMNGTIIAPGETFSFNEVVGPRTAAAGYQVAPQTNGQGRGGGICQVATTMYNLVLFGNLKITDRSQHSAPVSYVPIGRDAMIYTTKCDFQFVNTTNYYIKLQAYASGGTVSLKLLTREEGVSPVDDVELNVTQSYSNGKLVYTLHRYYKGEHNYTARTRY